MNVRAVQNIRPQEDNPPLGGNGVEFSVSRTFAGISLGRDWVLSEIPSTNLGCVVTGGWC